VVDGQGEAPRERCITCHNQPEKLERYGDLERIHAVHVTEKTIDCVRCHNEIKHKLPPPIGTPRAGHEPSPLAVQARRGSGTN
jgi:hypothetical protein